MKKSKFRGRCKEVEEDWKLLEMLGFLSDFRDVAIPRAWAVAAELGSEVELRVCVQELRGVGWVG